MDSLGSMLPGKNKPAFESYKYYLLLECQGSELGNTVLRPVDCAEVQLVQGSVDTNRTENVYKTEEILNQFVYHAQ